MVELKRLSPVTTAPFSPISVRFIEVVITSRLQLVQEWLRKGQGADGVDRTVRGTGPDDHEAGDSRSVIHVGGPFRAQCRS